MQRTHSDEQVIATSGLLAYCRALLTRHSKTTGARRTRHLQPAMAEVLEAKTLLAADLGDAPDSGAGTGTGNYETLAASGGPSHTIDVTQGTLFLGNSVDGDIGSLQNATANADDVDSALPDDEDGVLSPVDLRGTVGAAPTITLLATNNTGSAATLAGWIDFNQDGVFDNGTERATIAVPNGTTDGRFTLTFPTIPTGSAGNTYARFRLSTDAAAMNSTGVATDGEVEDHVFSIYRTASGSADSSVIIANNTNGGPDLSDGDSFGVAVGYPGDLDGDGIGDLIVGDRADDTGGNQRGAVYVQLLNSDGTVKSSVKIAHELNGGPSLADANRFGASLTSIGDLDGDGITDVAVGAHRDSTGGVWRGAVHILFMNSDGTVKGSTKIASGTGGGPTLADRDYFGSSVASLGDLDGDGIVDLVVGADGDDTGGARRGAIHVVLLNADGSAKSTSKIASDVISGIGDEDRFGRAATAIGDVDKDGVVDLAVGAGDSDDGNKGSVHILFMNADGSVKSSRRVANGSNGGPSLADNDSFGRSVGATGDLDGDGVPDLVVGASGDSAAGSFRGAVYALYLNPDGTVKNHSRIASGVNGGPTLADSDAFGTGVAGLGDLNGDGVADLAVGSSGYSDKGAYYVMFMTGAVQNLPAPVITTPDDLVTPDSMFTLEWDAVVGAEVYEVWYSDWSAGQSIIVDTTNTTSYTPSTPLPLGQQDIWVRVKQDNAVSDWSTPISVFVTAPVQSVDVSFLGSDSTPTFTWDALPGATRYEVWVNNILTGQSQVITDTSITQTTYTASVALNLGQHRVWVRGFDPLGRTSVWSSPVDFSAGPRPVGPLNPTFDVRPTFEWTSVANASTYELFVRTSGGDIVQSGLTGTSWTPSSDLPDGTLYWWVRGYNGATPGPWSDRVDSGIGGKPILLTPSGTSGDASPQFTWSPVTGATRYSLYVSRIDVPGLAFRQDTLTTTSFTSSILEDGSYRAWVRAFDGSDSPGLWSSPVNFTVDAATGVLTTSPTSPLTATFDTTPTFTWSTATGASSHDLYLTNGTTVIEQTGLTSPTFTQGSALASGNWKWWVRAVDGSSNPGPWSNPASLHIGGQTTVTAPVGSTADTTPTFQWAAVAGAGRYILHVETLGGSVVIREDNLTGTSFTPSSALASGSYRVWVKAISADDDVTGIWSDPISFTITAVTDEDEGADILLTSLDLPEAQTDGESRATAVRPAAHEPVEQTEGDTDRPAAPQRHRRNGVVVEQPLPEVVQNSEAVDVVMLHAEQLLAALD